MSDPFLLEIVKKIKDKKELRDLDDDFVLNKVLSFLEKKPKIKERLNKDHFFKSKEFELLKKEVRKELRKSYGLFQLDNKKETDNLLLSHQSTKERFPFYRLFYKYLTELIKPKVIFDLGAGFNVGSIPLLERILNYPVTYFGTEISSEDVKLVLDYLSKHNINGSFFRLDIISERNKLIELIDEKKPDLIMMLKLVDTLEGQERHFTKKLIPELIKKAPLLVSFSKKSISSHKKLPERFWFKAFLKKNGFSFDYFEIPNEDFYLLHKINTKE